MNFKVDLRELKMNDNMITIKSGEDTKKIFDNLKEMNKLIREGSIIMKKLELCKAEMWGEVESYLNDYNSSFKLIREGEDFLEIQKKITENN